jgi:hypothetical protein
LLLLSLLLVLLQLVPVLVLVFAKFALEPPWPLEELSLRAWGELVEVEVLPMLSPTLAELESVPPAWQQPEPKLVLEEFEDFLKD